MKLTQFALVLLTLSNVSLSQNCLAQDQMDSTRLVTEELSLGHTKFEWREKNTSILHGGRKIVISPDQSRVALVDLDLDIVIVDGIEGDDFDEVVWPVFNYNSEHVVYLARKEDKWLVVTDGQKGKEYDNIDEYSSSIPTPPFLFFSPDGGHVAYGGQNRKKWVVVLDGKESKEYKEVGFLTFSLDSQHLAYQARLGNKWMVVLDEQEGAKYDDLGYPPVFSPDSKRMAYVAKHRGKYTLVLDGKESGEYGWILSEHLIFSPDGNHLAYVAKRGKKMFVVVDGQEGREYDKIQTLQQSLSQDEKNGLEWSPDSRHLAYVAERAGKQIVVADEQESREFDEIRGLTFTSDNRLVYRARRGDKHLVVVDGQEGKEYDECWKPECSSDGMHIAYRAKRGKKEIFVLDGKESKEFDYINEGAHSSYFSPDGTNVVFRAKQAGKWLVVINGRESNQYGGIGDVIFSNDSQHFAYVSSRYEQLPPEVHHLPGGGEMVVYPEPIQKWFVVLDGREKKEEGDEISSWSYERGNHVDRNPVFSPDGHHLAYVTKRGPRWIAVIGEQEGKEYDEISEIVFSPDSKHVAYRACEGGRWMLVVDGHETAHCDFFLRQAKVIFDSANILRTLAVRGDEIFLVKVTLEQ